MIRRNIMTVAIVYILFCILLVYSCNLFEPDTYTVTYNGNGNTGGTVPTDTIEYAAGDTVNVKENIGTLNRTGYLFTGWNAK